MPTPLVRTPLPLKTMRSLGDHSVGFDLADPCCGRCAGEVWNVAEDFFLRGTRPSRLPGLEALPDEIRLHVVLVVGLENIDGPAFEAQRPPQLLHQWHVRFEVVGHVEVPPRFLGVDDLDDGLLRCGHVDCFQ